MILLLFPFQSTLLTFKAFAAKVCLIASVILDLAVAVRRRESPFSQFPLLCPHPPTSLMIRFILVQNRQGKTRLAKFYVPYSDEEKSRLKGEVHRLIAPRDQKYQSNFVEYRNHKVVYRRYAGLFFCVCVDANDNELAYLEAIHLFVEVLGE